MDLPQISHREKITGQSLIELLVAISVGGIFILGAISVLVPALIVNQQVTPVETGASLGAELLNNVRAWSEGDWHRVLTIATGTTNIYYINTSSSPFVAIGATSTNGETVAIGTSTYRRYFYITNVMRLSGAIVPSGGADDPSTKSVTVVYQLPSGATSGLTTYLTRHGQGLYRQTDWSGGSGVSGPATTTNSRFSSSSNISYTTTTGSIYVSIPGY